MVPVIKQDSAIDLSEAPYYRFVGSGCSGFFGSFVCNNFSVLCLFLQNLK